MTERHHVRLLLVDDEEHFRETLTKRLGRRGMIPEQAGTGKAALSVLEAKPVDVVILDVKMPGMDGFEVLDKIKQKYPQIEVILLTGHSTTQDGVDGIKSGAFDYLSKPIEIEHLVSKVEQAYAKIQRDREKQKEAEFRAKLEQQLRTTEKLASLGTLAAGVAHEINNPLAIMKESVGYMKQLLGKPELSHMPRKQDFEMALNKIDTGIERTRRITHQLLSFVREGDSVQSEVDLVLLMEEAVDFLHREAVDKEIKIVLDRNSDEARRVIQSDPYQLRQVLINLLTNAIQATQPGGKVTLSLAERDDDVSITVSDTGKGIPKENLERIFEPFFSTKGPGEGTGLGLFVSRSILEKLDGHIEVESRVGQGASFHVRLPKQQRKTKISDGSDSPNLIEQLKGYVGTLGEESHD